MAISLILLLFPSVAFSKPLLPPISSSPSTELRGVWLTNVASGVLFSPWGINKALKRLSQLNFNTVYPVVWNRGHTFYPSYVAKRVTGRAEEPLLTVMRGGADTLAEIINQAKQEGLSVIPWFEYGFIAPANSDLVKRRPNWLTQSRDSYNSFSDNHLEQDLLNSSSKISNFFVKQIESIRNKAVRQQVWLNPFHPGVQTFITELILEVVSNYDVDGIQLDDHFGMPVDLGYDPYTIKLYQQQHQGLNPPDDPFDPEWMRWRANKITNLMAQIDQAVKSVKPNIKVILSPNSQQFSYKNYLQDWQTWVQRGLVDELILQVYRDNLSSFIAELEKPAVQKVRRLIPVSIGILTGIGNHPVGIEQIQQQVQVVRDRRFNGVSFFYWESLWGYITPESPRQRRKVFQALFPEPALRPKIAQW
ncbi:MAG: family 10 glycosylhydrolase [Moorea sp. SIO2B7]|nr:family 10 glycosylhydrolase [Moorena sp. SIO2B7]